MIHKNMGLVRVFLLTSVKAKYAVSIGAQSGGITMRLTRAVRAWGTPGFRDELAAEIAGMDPAVLPLQRALRYGNYVLDQPPTVIINGVDERDGAIVVRAGLFFAGVDAGSCCASDPTPVESHQEYCVLQLTIDPTTGDARIELLDT